MSIPVITPPHISNLSSSPPLNKSSFLCQLIRDLRRACLCRHVCVLLGRSELWRSSSDGRWCSLLQIWRWPETRAARLARCVAFTEIMRQRLVLTSLTYTLNTDLHTHTHSQTNLCKCINSCLTVTVGENLSESSLSFP